MVEAKLMEDGRVQVAAIVRILNGAVANFVRFAMRHATFDASTRQPH